MCRSLLVSYGIMGFLSMWVCVNVSEHPVCDPCPHLPAQNARKYKQARSGRHWGMLVSYI